jgi:translocation and assembly module TamB
VLRLNVAINAPNRIFVRGRGLDVELGGQVAVTGPVTGVQPVGGFRIIRGRLSILGQRITFDEGTVTLVGDLDPFLNFVARSERSDITVFITVTGRASDLDISFSSQPELPEDEVLARLIFDRGIDQLSPLQLAQLAAAAAELAGGADTGLLGALRGATGRDQIVQAVLEGVAFAARDNLAALVDALNKAKPAATKGIFLKKLSVSSTMGLGVKVDVASLSAQQ